MFFCFLETNFCNGKEESERENERKRERDRDEKVGETFPFFNYV